MLSLAVATKVTTEMDSKPVIAAVRKIVHIALTYLETAA